MISSQTIFGTDPSLPPSVFSFGSSTVHTIILKCMLRCCETILAPQILIKNYGSIRLLKFQNFQSIDKAANRHMVNNFVQAPKLRKVLSESELP